MKRRRIMARTRKTISIEDKIEKAQQKVISSKAKYDAAVAELRTLYDKRTWCGEMN